jgi:cephalosporin hydroxylase
MKVGEAWLAVEGLPPPVTIELDESLRTYWFKRVAQHMDDSYAGVPLLKFPEDLRVYEHLLWLSRANVVIEIGTRFGGSALWFRDRLRTFATYRDASVTRVITIDVDASVARESIGRVDPSFDGITLVEADVRDPGLPDRVAKLVPCGGICLVVEDSAHVYETTRQALRGFARFVPVGGFFVVEDGCVDVEEMRPDPLWPRGVLPAIADWLETLEGRKFVVRRDLERYGITCHPSGFLERVG